MGTDDSICSEFGLAEGQGTAYSSRKAVSHEQQQEEGS